MRRSADRESEHDRRVDPPPTRHAERRPHGLDRARVVVSSSAMPDRVVVDDAKVDADARAPRPRPTRASGNPHPDRVEERRSSTTSTPPSRSPLARMDVEPVHALGDRRKPCGTVVAPRRATPSPTAAPVRCRCWRWPSRGGCAARASAGPADSDVRPFVSTDTPTRRPGSERLYASRVAMNPACGPPKPSGTPKRWLEPTTQSAPAAPGDCTSTSASRSAATATNAPASCARCHERLERLDELSVGAGVLDEHAVHVVEELRWRDPRRRPRCPTARPAPARRRSSAG